MDILLQRYRLVRVIAFAAFVCVAYGPLVGALAGAVGEPDGSLLDVLSSRRMVLLAHSLIFSLTIAFFTMAVGVLAALSILRRLAPHGAERLQWLLLATVALPPTISALSWSYFFSLLPALTSVGVMGSWPRAGVAQGMALLPFATGIALVALRATDPLLLDAARVLVSPARRLFMIAVPLARPTLVSGAALIFLLSLLDYTIPSIFGVNVYSMEIFVAFSVTHLVSDAFWLSLPLTACALALVASLSGLPRRLAQNLSSGFHGDGSLSFLLEGTLLLAAIIVGSALLAPLLSFLPALGDPAYLGRTIAASWPEVGYTLFTSATAAFIALLLAIGPAIELSRGGQSARLLWAVCLLPFLFPPALTGVGLIALWSPLHVIDIYGSHWMSIAAELARFTPVAIVVLSTWLLRLDPGLMEAAMVAGSSLRRTLSGIVLPLAIPGLTAAAGVSFVLSLGEIGANLLVTPAGSATLSMKTYNYLHYGGSQAAAGLCLLLMVLAGVGALATALPVLLLNRKASMS